jgi:NAD/NADP transhydrogenase alpha subunit
MTARYFSSFGQPVNQTTIGVPKETFENEQRVAISPEATQRLSKLGFKINVASDAGINAAFSDEMFKKAGADIVS